MKPIRAFVCEPIALARPLVGYVDGFDRRGTFLLGGARLPAGDPRACFDLLGAEPVASFRAWRAGPGGDLAPRRARVRVEDGASTREEERDFATALRAFVDEARRGRTGSCPLPLAGGVVGYLGYECGQLLERLPPSRRAGLGLPDALLNVHDWVLGVRRRTGEAFLAVVGRGDDDEEAARDLETKRTRVRVALEPSSRARPRVEEAARPAPAFAIDDEGYRARVARAKELVDAGEAFEICLTNRVSVPVARPPLELFERLAEASPAPYAAYLAVPEATIVSSSPERFLKVETGGVVESRPIKGTRPRGRDASDDDALRRELAASEKDVAENTMIVDLVRNDLGKVCSFGSVQVPELCVVETYATVHQLVSSVRGTLSPGEDAVTAALACFPPGSMTGAPKVEAMVRIDELEPVERGPYAGALGYFAFDGSADLSVVIRTAVVKDGIATIGTGGAVTTDSSPEAELEESHVKLRAVLEAIARTEAP